MYTISLSTKSGIRRVGLWDDQGSLNLTLGIPNATDSVRILTFGARPDPFVRRLREMLTGESREDVSGLLPIDPVPGLAIAATYTAFWTPDHQGILLIFNVMTKATYEQKSYLFAIYNARQHLDAWLRLLQHLEEFYDGNDFLLTEDVSENLTEPEDRSLELPA